MLHHCQSVLKGTELAILGNPSHIRAQRTILLECRTCAMEKWTIELKEQLELSLWRVGKSSARD